MIVKRRTNVRPKTYIPSWRTFLMAKAPTKTAVLNSIAEKSGLNKKDVAAVLDALAASIGETISDGETPFTIPGLCKVVPQIKPATEARFGVPNPFRPGETMDVAAKPER
ncbi:MAG TPA: DNA-binding protein, partial [Planctomycetaceae bacterium]|nr:DNA-binding protein [Planctomycetaceae bacterium]